MDARKVAALGLLVGCAGPVGTDDEVAPPVFRVDRVDMHSQGMPFMVTGELGRIPVDQLASVSTMRAALDEAMPSIADQLRVPAADLVMSRSERDDLGITHVRYDQVKNGLPVVSGRVVVHVDRDGGIRLVTNSARDASVDARATVAADVAASTARGTDGQFDAGAPRLVYEISSRDGDLRLTWEVLVTGRESLLDDAWIFVDAHTGAIVDRHPVTFPAKMRRIYDGGDRIYPTTMVTQIGSEATPPTGATPVLTSAIAAFNNTGTTHDFYKTVYNRDSYDGNGHSLDSVVNVRFGAGPTGGDNAVWYSPLAQMAYGQGDGVEFSPLAAALDVTAHELTHAVTSATADLVYQGESGALNEAMSDIMGATCETWKKGGTVDTNTWLIGEDIYSPGTPGDALRYMADPTADHVIYDGTGAGTEFVSSRDFYADRYNGTGDNGGVHFNSGIANLAFNLLSVGGKHPHNKTTHNVPSIGIDKAGKIFEYALTAQLFTGNTGFVAARAATEQSAMMNFGPSEKSAVSLAWAAVGVGGLPPADPNPPTVTISNPTGESQVLPGFQIQVDATDDVGILRIELSIDGAPVAMSNSSPLTFTAPATLVPGMRHIQATAYDAFNQATKAVNVQLAQVCVMDPECPMDQHCEAGVCAPGAPKEPDSGGCCSTGGGSPTGAFVLGFGTLLVLRRRRRA